MYIPAITGLVPDEIVQAISSFTEFCYLARLDVHTETTLKQMDAALARFHQHREVFRQTGVRPDGFDSLPRQHSLKHQMTHIRNFGALNGLCTSIMESKHIKAVKEPWRRSSRYEALGQMLLTNQRLDKLAAARVDFVARGMLGGSSISYALDQLAETETGAEQTSTEQQNRAGNPHLLANNENKGDGDDANNDDTDGTIEGSRDRVEAVVKIAKTPGTFSYSFHCLQRSLTLYEITARGYPGTLLEIGTHISIPNLPDLVAVYLYDQANSDTPWEPSDPLPILPEISKRIHIVHSATATFYAPSDPSGTGGMRQEMIRATPSWRKGPSRYDCVFISGNPEDGFRGLHVARVRLFFRIRLRHEVHECALVEWFSHYDSEPDDETGMWIVTPDFDADGSRTRSVVHTDTIVRGCHLIPVYGKDPLPRDFSFHTSLDRFQAYYVNRYIDYHAFETVY